MSASSTEVLDADGPATAAAIVRAASPHQAPRREKRRHAPVVGRHGPPTLVAVCADSAPAPSSTQPALEDLTDGATPMFEGHRFLLGLLVVSWHVCATAGDLCATEQAFLKDGTTDLLNFTGAIFYHTDNSLRIIPARAHIDSLASAQTACSQSQACRDFSKTLRLPITEWLVAQGMDAQSFFDDDRRIFAMVSMKERIAHSSWPLIARPSRGCLRSAFPDRSRLASGCGFIVLVAPPIVDDTIISQRKLLGRSATDWLRFFTATRYLRDARDTDACMEAMIEAIWGGRHVEFAGFRQGEVPTRTEA